MKEKMDKGRRAGRAAKILSGMIVATTPAADTMTDKPFAIHEIEPSAKQLSERIRARVGEKGAMHWRQISARDNAISDRFFNGVGEFRNIREGIFGTAMKDPARWEELAKDTTPRSPEGDVELHLKVERILEMLSRIRIHVSVIEEMFAIDRKMPGYLSMYYDDLISRMGTVNSLVSDFFKALKTDRDAVERAIARELMTVPLPAQSGPDAPSGEGSGNAPSLEGEEPDHV